MSNDTAYCTQLILIALEVFQLLKCVLKFNLIHCTLAVYYKLLF